MLAQKLIFSCLVFLCFLLISILLPSIALAIPTSPPQVSKTVHVNTELQAELLAMQQAIIKLQQKKLSYPNGKLPLRLIDEIAELDDTNSLRLQEIIKQYGWPSIDLVGIKARDAAFIVLQQAKQPLQENLLPLLQSEFEQGQLSGQKLATFIDIMLIKSGKKQRYGTQLAIVNGQIVFNTIADKSNLDQRRQAMKMLPMAQYKILLKQMYKLD